MEPNIHNFVCLSTIFTFIINQYEEFKLSKQLEMGGKLSSQQDGYTDLEESSISQEDKANIPSRLIYLSFNF